MPFLHGVEEDLLVMDLVFLAQVVEDDAFDLLRNVVHFSLRRYLYEGNLYDVIFFSMIR